MAGPGQVTPRISWPDGKQFAFSVFDDTDLSAPGNFEGVYELLGSLGMRTTKSVWAATGPDLQQRSAHGSTCDDADYLRTVLRLQQSGFEIAYHNSYYEGLPRARIEEEARAITDRIASLPEHSQRVAKQCIAAFDDTALDGFRLEREAGSALLDTARTQELIGAFLDKNTRRKLET